MDLTDKVAIITGGRRMGAVMAARLAGLGVDVALTYHRSRAEAERAAQEAAAAGRRAIAVEADLREPSAAARLVDGVAARFGRLDIVINMASIFRHTPFDALTDDDWTAALDVDLTAAWRTARAATPHLRAAGGGHLVQVTDWVAASGRPRYTGYLPYYVAKRAVIGLTEALALELAPDRILVNAVAPGPLLPPAALEADDVEAVERETPLGRWGGAAALADTVAGLLQTDFITGETIRVDGGRHLK